MKKKCSPFTIITLLVALAGLVVAVLALLDRRCCALCEDLDDENEEDLVEYLDDSVPDEQPEPEANFENE